MKTTYSIIANLAEVLLLVAGVTVLILAAGMLL